MRPCVGDDGPHRAAGRLDRLDPHAGAQRRAERPGAGGEGLRQPRRFQVSVAGEPAGGEHVVDLERRRERGGLGPVEQVQVEPVGGGGADLPVQLVHPFRRGGQAQAADAAPARVEPGLVAQFRVQGRRIHDHFGLGDGRTQLADEAGRVPGGALGQVVLLEEHDVGPAQPGEVVGDAATGHAAADDHGAGAIGKGDRHRGVITPGAGQGKSKGLGSTQYLGAWSIDG